MPKKSRNSLQVRDESSELKNRLEEMEETLRAIRQYMVDAFVVTRSNGVQVVTLSEADFPYRRMVESMNEGAVTLIPDGTIFYCNPRFAQMVERDADKLIGVRFQDLISADQQQHFQSMLHEAGPEGLRGEFCLEHGEGDCVPVQLSFYQLRADDANGIAIIATDITERIESEEKIRSLAADLTIAEQEERHRISQVLHDDLQQRLFAIRAQLSFLLEAFKENNLPADMHVSIDQVQGWLSEAINITRNLSVDISPAVLQGDGIGEAISWLSSRMKEQYGLQLKVEVKDDLRHLQDHMRVTLFQAVRELLFNVVKHSGTLEAVATMEKLDGSGRITITDEGRGFDAKTVLSDPQAMHGLMILRDRLNLMGGTIEIESVPGNGTRARIEFPVEKLAA
ncbi:MAG: PAS domain S-box protein [Byssovorax cruenta]